MADRIHIEGMGVLGSLLGRALEALEIPFTWHDDNTIVQAYQASTGLIYPDGDPEAVEGYRLWQEWLADDENRVLGAGSMGLSSSVEEVPYLFTQARPPSGARVGWSDTDAEPWKVADAPAYACSVPHLVNWSRVLLSHRSTLAPPDGARVVVAHGFNERLARYLWGWSAPVQLEGDPPAGVRGAYVHRHPREAGNPLSGKDGYLYPIAHDPTWYWAGSDMISQKLGGAKPLKVMPKYAAWESLMAEVGVTVAYRENFKAAWRPVPEKGDDELVREMGGRLVVRPMSHSGVRKAPLIVNAILDHLEVS